MPGLPFSIENHAQTVRKYYNFYDCHERRTSAF
jgi:hypothetical protein